MISLSIKETHLSARRNNFLTLIELFLATTFSRNDHVKHGECCRPRSVLMSDLYDEFYPDAKSAPSRKVTSSHNVFS